MSIICDVGARMNVLFREDPNCICYKDQNLAAKGLDGNG